MLSNSEIIVKFRYRVRYPWLFKTYFYMQHIVYDIWLPAAVHLPNKVDPPPWLWTACRCLLFTFLLLVSQVVTLPPLPACHVCSLHEATCRICCLSLGVVVLYLSFANCLSCLFPAWGCLSYLLLVPCVVVLYLPFVTSLSCLFPAWGCLSYLLLVPCVVVLYLPFANCLSCLYPAWGCLSYLLLGECRYFLFLSSFLSLLLVSYKLAVNIVHRWLCFMFNNQKAGCQWDIQ